MKHIDAISNTPILPEHYKELLSVSLIKGAQATTAIEGNTLSYEEIGKIIKDIKLPHSKEYQAIEVKNIIFSNSDSNFKSNYLKLLLYLFIQIYNFVNSKLI